jgi:hypothetical protein
MKRFKVNTQKEGYKEKTNMEVGWKESNVRKRGKRERG